MICFPKSCTNSDLKEILEVYLFQTTTYVRNVTYIRHRIVTKNYRVYEDFNFYIMMWVRVHILWFAVKFLIFRIILFGCLLIHLTVYLLRKYFVQVNRRNMDSNLKCPSGQEEEKSEKSKASLDNTFVNVGEWKSTLGSVDLRQFTMTRNSTKGQGRRVHFNWLYFFTSQIWYFQKGCPRRYHLSIHFISKNYWIQYRYPMLSTIYCNPPQRLCAEWCSYFPWPFLQCILSANIVLCQIIWIWAWSITRWSRETFYSSDIYF